MGIVQTNIFLFSIPTKHIGNSAKNLRPYFQQLSGLVLSSAKVFTSHMDSLFVHNIEMLDTGSRILVVAK